VILITSALAKEGKSITTANIGIGLAELGEKVILLDCDLRNPSLHKWFNINRKPGLVEVLEGEIKLEEGIQKIRENLFILPSGKIIEHPALMLEKEKVNTLFLQLRKMFALIFIDTPCLLSAVDGVILNTLADSSLLVLQYGSTPQDVSLRGKTLLQEGKENLLGVIFTKVDGFKLKKYYYPYYKTKSLTSSS
jgi:capsular exopolysaccharide synthesis family protein